VHAAFGMYDVLPLPYEFKNMETRAAPFYTLESTSNVPSGPCRGSESRIFTVGPAALSMLLSRQKRQKPTAMTTTR
jgi:hypothetical protein